MNKSGSTVGAPAHKMRTFNESNKSKKALKKEAKKEYAIAAEGSSSSAADENPKEGQNGAGPTTDDVTLAARDKLKRKLENKRKS